MVTELGTMTADEIVTLARRHTLFDWSAQSAVAPIAVDRAEGVYFWDVDGKRYLDLNSQLMGVNIGHGDPRVMEAIARQGERLPYVSPFMVFEGRAVLGRKLAELFPGDIEKFFFTLGGAEANEHAIKLAKLATGRPKVLARYRSYHGATGFVMQVTGDPRRWPNELPPLPGIVHVLDPYHGTARGTEEAGPALERLEETIQLEGPETIACFLLETVTGTNGVLIPPDGYLEGVRAICDRYGILMIADEVMCGFGRTGEWFAVDHWKVVPDLVTSAKGLTSCYLPLGAIGMRPKVAERFDDRVFWGGLTYNTHPLCVAAAIATIDVMEADDLLANARQMGDVLRRHHEELAGRHPSVGRYRNLGLFGILELVKSRETMEPLSPFNAQNETMGAINRYLLDHGVSTMLRWHNVMTNPPLCITEAQLAEAFEVVDGALAIADAAMEG
ncbi:MAG: aminotransferase class III-fold pyridoxal phosphate-dependent enzyme [Actinobacteria bacterium]|nr:MAG: aminotransferase class III-fold pyridoxal phosphate-dependent enzyme [Actinomycetota bacterium]